MKFAALTFDLSMQKLNDIGRTWGTRIYKEKDFIFEFSAASYATFIAHNPDKDLTIMTDNVSLLNEKLNKYDIDLSNTKVIDWSKEIEEFKKHKFAFKPLMELISLFKDCGEYTVRLDNDLVCKSKIENDFGDPESVVVWKAEGMVKDGDIRWGERLVCETVFNETNFMRYNIGVLGMPVKFLAHYQEYLDNCEKLINVDITPVSDLGVKMYHVCEQTSYNWLMHKYNFKVKECDNIFDHHFEVKGNCISAAIPYLKKEFVW